MPAGLATKHILSGATTTASTQNKQWLEEPHCFEYRAHQKIQAVDKVQNRRGHHTQVLRTKKGNFVHKTQ